MDRKEFLSLLGLGAGAIVIPACIAGCKKDDDNTGPTLTTNLKLNLNDSANTVLNVDGGYRILPEGILVLNKSGIYYAVQAVCPHEQGSLIYDNSEGKVNCTKHTDQFYSVKGVSERQQTDINLKTYTCVKLDNILTVSA